MCTVFCSFQASLQSLVMAEEEEEEEEGMKGNITCPVQLCQTQATFYQLTQLVEPVRGTVTVTCENNQTQAQR